MLNIYKKANIVSEKMRELASMLWGISELVTGHPEESLRKNVWAKVLIDKSKQTKIFEYAKRY